MTPEIRQINKKIKDLQQSIPYCGSQDMVITTKNAINRLIKQRTEIKRKQIIKDFFPIQIIKTIS